MKGGAGLGFCLFISNSPQEQGFLLFYIPRLPQLERVNYNHSLLRNHQEKAGELGMKRNEHGSY